ncbi:MAG: hypothetical protein HC883_00770 [Bdellovibrionaceae bacterium]|nr:hypothetical protein [Pseudobdellovibrionaceae bacterium]
MTDLDCLEEGQFEEFLKSVFLNSRNLGLSYQKANNLTWEKSDFSAFAKDLGSPCLGGVWDKKTSAHVLSRGGCGSGKSAGQRFCQYWREAIDGLVIGISDDVGFVRNSSVGVGDDSCVDVFYDDESIPTDAIWDNANKWGALPNEIRGELELIELKFGEMKIDLKFLGLSERNLLYKLEPKENLTCGSAGSIYRSHLEKLIKEKFPRYGLKDASPVAVYGERA